MYKYYVSYVCQSDISGIYEFGSVTISSDFPIDNEDRIKEISEDIKKAVATKMDVIVIINWKRL